MNADTKRVIRRSYGDNRWFPGSKSQLESMISSYVDKAETPKISGRITGVFAPHAGYQYSGKVAGHAFRAIRDNAKAGYQPDVAVVLGFSHRGGFPGVALMDGDAIKTPLGEIELDKNSARILTDHSSRISFKYTPHAGEWSAENEIPFVQHVLPGTKIVVGIIGDHDKNTLDDLVDALTELAKKKKILVVASTDMLHHPDYDLVTKTDKATLEKVKTMDHAGIRKTWEPDHQIFCGLMPVLTVMQFTEAQGCKKATVLHYRNCGDDFPESRGNNVVGYSAVAFTIETN
ncbi:AmmeMemoRadiSam system protein B [Verrucomicrobiota bacterium]